MLCRLSVAEWLALRRRPGPVGPSVYVLHFSGDADAPAGLMVEDAEVLLGKRIPAPDED